MKRVTFALLMIPGEWLLRANDGRLGNSHECLVVSDTAASCVCAFHQIRQLVMARKAFCRPLKLLRVAACFRMRSPEFSVTPV